MEWCWWQLSHSDMGSQHHATDDRKTTLCNRPIKASLLDPDQPSPAVRFNDRDPGRGEAVCKRCRRVADERAQT